MSISKTFTTLCLSIALFSQPGFARDRGTTPLRGAFSGSATETPTSDPFVFEATITGSGYATPIGPCRLSARHFIDGRTLAFGNGSIAFVGKDGAILGSYSGQFYPTQAAGVFTFAASIKITGGTGKYRGAVGKGSLAGTVNSNTNPEQFAAIVDAVIELADRD